MLTEQVKLADGVEYGGGRHKVLTIRSSIVKDSLNAEKKAEGKGLVYLSLAVLAEQIVEFGDIPKDKITPDLLAQLCDEDFERLQEAREYLKKKARWQRDD